MSGLLTQLDTLLLRAIPTIVLFALVWLGYRLIVHGKLVRVLSERRDRTEGAAERARADISAAEARTAEYEQKIRDAKLVAYKAQELRRRQQLEANASALAEARKEADARVRSAHESLESDFAQAKTKLQAEVVTLVNQIKRAVLKPRSAAESTFAGR